jgi:hypothetical protein
METIFLIKNYITEGKEINSSFGRVAILFLLQKKKSSPTNYNYIIPCQFRIVMACSIFPINLNEDIVEPKLQKLMFIKRMFMH